MHLKAVVISLVSFILFYTEALLHFNYGLKSCDDRTHKYINLTKNMSILIPSRKEAFHMALTIFVFASISGYISAYVIHRHLV